MDLGPFRRQVPHVLERAPALLAQLHDRPQVGRRRNDRGQHERLLNVVVGTRLWHLAWVVHRQNLGTLDHAELHVGSRGDELQVELALQALLHDVHVEEPEEAASEAEPKGERGLRLIDQGRVGELELIERVVQERVVAALRREQAAPHHGLRLAVAGERLGRRVRRKGHRVADLRLTDVLHPSHEVADLARGELGGRDRVGREDPDLLRFGYLAIRHVLEAGATHQFAVDDADVGDDTPVGVVAGVEDERAGGLRRVAGGRGNAGHDGVEQLAHALPRLRADPQDVARLAADEVGELVGDGVRVRGGQVDLVEGRDDGQARVAGQMVVGQGLRFDPLGGINEEDGALARREASRHLVREVDVAGRIDEVQLERRSTLRVGEPDRLRLDRDPALAFEVHPVEVLLPHLAGGHRVRQVEEPIRQGRLAVVDVRDDAEVPDEGEVHRHARVRGTRFAVRAAPDAHGGSGSPVESSALATVRSPGLPLPTRW